MTEPDEHTGEELGKISPGYCDKMWKRASRPEVLNAESPVVPGALGDEELVCLEVVRLEVVRLEVVCLEVACLEVVFESRAWFQKSPVVCLGFEG